jgi:hypothetical protein
MLNAAAGAGAIYRCESADGVTFSDRPCGANAAVHQSGDRISVMDAPPISKRASEPRPRAADKTGHKGAAAHADRLAKRQASCARLDQSLREVRAKLRTGYGVKEGERLKARQRQLAQRRRTEKCG